MAKKKQSEKEKGFKVFRCSCGNETEMGFDEFKHHLFTEHNLKHDQLKGKRQMVSHLDAEEWFSSTYEWKLETGLRFHEFVQLPRAKDDMMRFV